MSSYLKIAFVIRNIGDYHVCRLLRLQSDIRVEGEEMLTIEATTTSGFYTHQQSRGSALKTNLNLKQLRGKTRISKVLGLLATLVKNRPPFIIVLGYNDELSLTALVASKLIKAQIFFLSDSKADDHVRNPVIERVKAALISRFDGAVVAGARHKQYFVKLGMNAASIRTGYDVVDNAFFNRRAAMFRAKRNLLGGSDLLKTKYVLCVSRLVPRKRVELAIRVFAESNLAAKGFRLLIVGEGPERQRLQDLILSLEFGRYIVLCGAVSNVRMPCYLAFASALVLTSEFDQWGLVVNEAMASGVPSLVTERCGCAGEIVINDINGYVWDGRDVRKGSDLLTEMVLDERKHAAFAEAGLITISQWGPELFSQSVRSLISRTQPAGGPLRSDVPST
jgi:glycosyltransferase involved in cell wall biosynthesis